MHFSVVLQGFCKALYQVAAVLCLCGGDIPGSETLEHQNTL